MAEVSFAAVSYRELARELGIAAAQARALVERHPEVGTRVGVALAFTAEEVEFLQRAMGEEADRRRRSRGRPSASEARA
jgi:hypothetical protein